MPALGTWWTHLWTSGPLWNPSEPSRSFPVQYRKNCTFFRNPKYDFPYIKSLPLDHSETPCDIQDLIRDSEQHSVTKSHNSYNTISSSNVKRADPTGSRTM